MKIFIISLFLLRCDVTTSFESNGVSYFLEEYTESALNLIEKGAKMFGLRLSLVKLDPVELTMDAIKNIHRWYNGARATKNIFDSFASIGSGVIGTKVVCKLSGINRYNFYTNSSVDWSMYWSQFVWSS